MPEIAERLALIIESKTGGAVTELKKTASSAEQLAVAQDRASLSAAKMSAAQDKLAASLAKQEVAEARAAGGAAEIATAQAASAAAVEKSAVSKAQAAAAADRLTVSELRAKEATAALGTTATGTTGLLGRLGLAGTSAGAALATLAPLLGFAVFAFGIKILKDGIEHFQKLTGQIRGLRNVTGGTAEQVSLLVGQMHQLGVEPDAAQKAFLRFGAAIGDGSTKLAAFGIEVAHNKDGTTDLLGTLENLRTAYQGSSDAATRDAIAKQLGGRAAAALIPLLKLTKEQVEDLNKATRSSGGVLNDADLKRGFEMKVAANQMKEAFENAELAISKGMIPALTKALELITKIVEVSNDFGSLESKGLGPVKPEQKLFGIPGTQGAAKFLFGEDKQSAAEAKTAIDQHTESLKKNKAAQDELTGALTGEINARRAVNDAVRNLEDARQGEIDAQDKLNKLLWEGAVDEKAVAAAKRDVESASRSVRNAIEAEHDAQQALNKARERATALDLEEAQSKLTLAGDRIAQAKASEQQAQEKLNALLGSGDSTAGQIAEAQANLKQRHDEVAQSIIDQSRASEDLTKTQQKGTDADPAVEAAQRRVRDAREQVTDATRNQQDALERLHTAEAGDPEWARKVRDARQDLADAHQNIADAQDAQITAALGLSTATDKLNTSLEGTSTNLQAIIDKFTALKGQGLGVDEILSMLGVAPTATDLPTYDNLRKYAPSPPYRPSSFPSTRNAGVTIENLTVQSDGSSKDIARETSWAIGQTVLPKIHQAA